MNYYTLLVLKDSGKQEMKGKIREVKNQGK